jgi:hypothetical protein
MSQRAGRSLPGTAALSVLTAVIYALLAASLWFPFGWQVGDLSDLRAFYVDIENGLLPLIAPADPRPLMLLATHLARALTPDSFVGANLLLWALLTLKALALYALMRQMLPRQPLLAFAAGALALILPVDTGVFWLVTINIHGYALGALTAAALLIAQWRQPRLWRWPLIALAQLLALSYEAAFLPLLIVPALLPLIDRPSRRMLRVALLWWALPLAAIVRFALLFTSSAASGYQASLIALGADAPGQMARALARVYERHAITGWIEAFDWLTRRAAWELSWFVSAAIGAAGAALGAAAHAAARGTDARLPLRTGLLALLVGAGLIGAGFAAFLPTVYRDINYRVHLFSVFGAAIALAVPLIWLLDLPRRPRQIGFLLGSSASFALASRLPIAAAIGLAGMLALPRRAAAAALLGAVTGAGALLLIDQHDRYVQIVRQQDWILSQIVTAAPAIAPETVIVVFDAPDRTGYAAFEWQRGVFESALRFLYQTSLAGFFCIPDGRTFGFFNEQCALTVEGIRLTSSAGETLFPFERALLFDFTREGGLSLRPPGADLPGYDPGARIDASAPPPPRAFTALIDYPTPRPASWLTFFDLR